MYIAKPTSECCSGGATGKFIKFIIASNRDEFFTRPTRTARFWDTDPQILAGLLFFLTEIYIPLKYA